MATAVIELMAAALMFEPRRVGRPLRDQVEDEARGGSHRLLYGVLQDAKEVVACGPGTDGTSADRVVRRRLLTGLRTEP